LGLLLAGNETTAAALSWALVEAAGHPAAWQQLRDDPAAHTGAFIQETLRLHPPAWGIPRSPTRAGCTLPADGVQVRIRRGQVATIYLRGIHQHPRIWADPTRFDPARHTTQRGQNQRWLLPFGLGPRGCIGQHLALAELDVALPALARHGDITVEGTPSEDANFSLRVRGGLRGRFTPSVATSSPGATRAPFRR
jgi:cytochrome P450